ncbi:hypothetical protein EJ02DRAFT_437878 [Clathrospora elynae]|uniref:Uncharacterized protein n=1 Tax=Clathrospora elynae TaxID=706981 RepID=A0A6A5SBU3_9PLEO|nr:hypothetical protein EJ02DRAFT_437878 [Clathrospora elynae]
MIPHLRRQEGDCPFGGQFHRCGGNGGFVGCCLDPAEEPCNPGVGCPADKDRTPGRYLSGDTATSTSIDVVTIMPVATISSSFRATASSAPTPTATDSSATPQSSLNESSTTSLVESTGYMTSTKYISGTTLPSAAIPPPDSHIHPAPVAAIVGSVLGAVIIIAIALCIYFCIRRRKRTIVYKAPKYPSPCVSNDMSPQLSGKASSQFQQKVASLYRAESRATRCDAQQLDSREIGRSETFSRRTIGQFAELPAEPLPWPGHSASN